MKEEEFNLKTKEVYKLSTNNCEDVVTLWTTGKGFSDQSERYFRRLMLFLFIFSPLYSYVLNNYDPFDMKGTWLRFLVKTYVYYDNFLYTFIYITAFL